MSTKQITIPIPDGYEIDAIDTTTGEVTIKKSEPDLEPWTPDYKGRYHFLDSIGVRNDLWTDHYLDNIRCNGWNIYRTREDAIRTAARERAMRKLHHLAEVLNPERVRRLGEHQKLWWIGFGSDYNGPVDVTWTEVAPAGMPVFYSLAAAQTALDQLTPEEIDALRP